VAIGLTLRSRRSDVTTILAVVACRTTLAPDPANKLLEAGTAPAPKFLLAEPVRRTAPQSLLRGPSLQRHFTVTDEAAESDRVVRQSITLVCRVVESPTRNTFAHRVIQRE
jgi:hypothetical protein